MVVVHSLSHSTVSQQHLSNISATYGSCKETRVTLGALSRDSFCFVCQVQSLLCLGSQSIAACDCITEIKRRADISTR